MARTIDMVLVTRIADYSGDERAAEPTFHIYESVYSMFHMPTSARWHYKYTS